MRNPALRIITANRLGDGRVVFLGPDGWAPAIEVALALEDEAAVEAALARATADAADNLVVDPYAIAVGRQAGRLRPERLRERIRLHGPTAGNSHRRPARAEAA